MKANLLPFLFVVILFQCKEKSKSDSVGSISKLEMEPASRSVLQDKLSQMVPFTSDQIFLLIPSEIGEFARVQLIKGNYEEIGVTSVASQFVHRRDTSKNVRVEILDGTGVNGSIFLIQSLERLTITFEAVNSSEKTRVFNHEGSRIFFREKLNNPVLEYELICSDRFRVKFQSDHLNRPELVEFIHLFPMNFLEKLSAKNPKFSNR